MFSVKMVCGVDATAPYFVWTFLFGFMAVCVCCVVHVFFWSIEEGIGIGIVETGIAAAELRLLIHSASVYVQ